MQKMALLFLSFKVICQPEKCKQRKLKILDGHLFTSMVFHKCIQNYHKKIHETHITLAAI